MGCQVDDAYLRSLHRHLIHTQGVAEILPRCLPEGVTVQARSSDSEEFLFVLNFSDEPRTVKLPDSGLRDLESGAALDGTMRLPAFGSRVLRRNLAPASQQA